MPELDAHGGGRPQPDEVRRALQNMAESEAFRGSPQLVAFLRYVVEATLRGEHDRIKGYTIAVEALGRADDFDPQSDPIVRVEAIRLRRAIARYRAGEGARDAVVIELPLGSYVPVFRCTGIAPQPHIMQSPRRRFRAPWRVGDWRRIAAALAFVLLGASIYGGLDFWFDFNTPNPQPAALFAFPPVRAAPGVAARPLSPYPVVFVGEFRPVGANAAAKPSAEALRGRLRDALARFDEIEVVSGALPGHAEASGAQEDIAAPGHYRLTASVASEDMSVINLSVRLTDALDGRVAYVRSFGGHGLSGSAPPGEEAIVREVSAMLAQPYGVIQAHERAREATESEPQYRCLIEAHDYWRNYDPRQYRRARVCLERATEASPGFALGYAALAPIVLEEYGSGPKPRSADAPALQRALAVARRAVELKPSSARAHQALSIVQFARGDYPLAIEAGERALLLNPYDPNVLADYGSILLALGEQERGTRMIREAASAIVVRPTRHDFFLFLTAYLAGDRAGAARYAALIVSDAYPLGLVARALVSSQRGDAETARQLLDRLAVLHPSWRSNYRAELQRYFPAESIAERLAHDLDRIGYVPGQ